MALALHFDAAPLSEILTHPDQLHLSEYCRERYLDDAQRRASAQWGSRDGGLMWTVKAHLKPVNGGSLTDRTNIVAVMTSREQYGLTAASPHLHVVFSLSVNVIFALRITNENSWNDQNRKRNKTITDKGRVMSVSRRCSTTRPFAPDVV